MIITHNDLDGDCECLLCDEGDETVRDGCEDV